MKNLNCSNKTPIDFFDEVLKSKRNSSKDPTYKTRVESYKPEINVHFTDYNNRYSNGTLIEITPKGYTGQTKDDLLDLYKYKNSVIQKLKTEVTTYGTNRTINTCQNCTINPINSIDHIIPKEEVSEFSVHPKNLFPSCTECNSIKNKFWRDGSQFLFLNLYIDPLPNLQFLFPVVNFVRETPDINFSINNPNGINPQLYSVILSHYTRLKLISRFKLDSDGVVSDLEFRISSLKNRLDQQGVIDSILEFENSKRNSSGYNYWKSLLTIELIKCQPYMDSLFV